MIMQCPKCNEFCFPISALPLLTDISGKYETVIVPTTDGDITFRCPHPGCGHTWRYFEEKRRKEEKK